MSFRAKRGFFEPVSESPLTVSHRDCDPHFADRNVVFVANLLALFFGNEAETEALRREVGEIDSYGGRLIPILDLLFRGDGENHLLLERAPDASLCEYFSSELGLSLPKVEQLPHDDYLTFSGASADRRLAVWRQIAADWLDGYVTDACLTGLAGHLGKRTLSTQQASRYGNDKVRLHRHLESEGLPTFATELVNSAEQIPAACLRLAAQGYSAAALRSPIGASGIGMMKVDFDGPPSTIADHFFNEGACLLQGWIESGRNGVANILSPSVQLFLDDDGVQLYDITEQILSGDSVHEGNEAPPPWLDNAESSAQFTRDELLRQAEVAARWLHAQGYRGTGSVDFIVAEKEDAERSEVFVCEINARVTGATYPALLARHFNPGGVWLLRNLRLSAPLPGDQLLTMLRSPGHLYQRGEVSGILPMNFNFGKDGLIHKGQFLCLGRDRKGSRHCLDLAKLNLPVSMQSERD